MPDVHARIRMSARPTDEPHRASSQLELLFDLTFVIAIAVLARQFADAMAAGHALGAILPFLQVFFAIWWAWVNFTWFASAFDTDDVPFRLLTLVQMGGVLVLAAGVPAALQHGDYRAITLGYAIMRLALLAHWLRAAIEDPESRGTALRYAAGLAAVEVLWLSRLALDEAGRLPAPHAVFLALVACELAIPVWAERRHRTSWHPHHIAERYGLFAIILFGESIYAASTGVERALAAGGSSVALVVIAALALARVFGLWWLYSAQSAGDGLVAHRERSYLWGYGHYGLLAALTALGAGLKLAVEQTGHSVAVPPTTVGYAIAIPLAAFLVLTWALHTPLTAKPALGPRVALASSATILILPALAQPTPAVITSMTAICALAVVSTVALD
jgi:low temperature requirement protein LtrA